MSEQKSIILADVARWLEQVVIGLNLCPFAKAPHHKNQIRFVICDETDEAGINQTLIEECQKLDQDASIETTLIICSNGLQDFFYYTQFLSWAEQTIKKNSWQGIYQLASFHPDYIFANADSDDRENLTNRAPYPVVHLLRQSSLNKVLENYNDAESIPEKNMQTMLSLTQIEIEKLFPYLFSK